MVANLYSVEYTVQNPCTASHSLMPDLASKAAKTWQPWQLVLAEELCHAATPDESPESFKVSQTEIDQGDPEVKRVRRVPTQPCTG